MKYNLCTESFFKRNKINFSNNLTAIFSNLDFKSTLLRNTNFLHKNSEPFASLKKCKQFQESDEYQIKLN